MGGKVGNFLNPTKSFPKATNELIDKGKLLASGKGKAKDFVTAADDLGSLGVGNTMGITDAVFGKGGGGAAANSLADPSFNFDPNQSVNDQAAINALGKSQYGDTLQGITDIGTANTQRAKDLFGEMLPDIAENSQTAHLYDSTGYGQEVARQQAEIASQVASGEAQQKQAALSGLQGFQTGALQRGMGLEDFINQANVAKAIGAQSVPQAPSSKATGMSGAASGAAAGTAIYPGWGTAIGAGVGYLGGSNVNQKGGK